MELESLKTLQQLFQSPWYVVLGVGSSIAAWAGWKQLERRWAFQRRKALEEWRHRQKVELELLDKAEEPDALRAAAEALARLRGTDPYGRSISGGRPDKHQPGQSTTDGDSPQARDALSATALPDAPAGNSDGPTGDGGSVNRSHEPDQT